MRNIEKILSDDIAGDPMSGLKWTKKSTEKISTELASIGIEVGPRTVGRLLAKMGFSLKTNRKTIISGGKRKPGYREKRNQQFLYIKKIKNSFEKKQQPIISVDTKKKEMLGNFKNHGKTWSNKPTNVHDHDFKSDSIGTAIPYGIYDLNKNNGYVIIGKSKDTSSFSTDAIEEWWRVEGNKHYPQTKHILIFADGGGSNSSRSRVWKKGIQDKLCDKYNLSVTICHYPPGASKWNPIEHRLFSEISKNWAGIPLKNFEIVQNYITTTTTVKGLRIKTSLNENIYKIGEKVSDQEFNKINILPSKILPEWNYTIRPNLRKNHLKM